MFRLIRATLIAALALAAISVLPDASAQTTVGVVQVSGRLPKNALRVFSTDTLYQMSGLYIIDSGAALVIAPGTTVQFLPNSRIVDSTGGKIIADGLPDIAWNPQAYPTGSQTWYSILSPSNNPLAYEWSKLPDVNPNEPSWGGAIFAAANGFAVGETYPMAQTAIATATPYAIKNIPTAPITFRGVPVNQFSVEWGNILILPGADSTFFRNCVFENMRKDTTVDQIPLVTGDNSQYPFVNYVVDTAWTTPAHTSYTRFTIR